MTLNWQIEPLGPWNRPVTHPRRPASRFTAPWADTLELLETELRHLGVTGAVAVRVDVQRGRADIRRDGMLRADARTRSPAVAVSFASRHGPLTYATDAYDDWRANVRAIALALEALRAVDRYGVGRSGEQYAGWRAIEPARPDCFPTASDAIRWLRTQPDIGTTDGLGPTELLRRAARVMHPDVGGDPARWDRLDQARQLIERSVSR